MTADLGTVLCCLIAFITALLIYAFSGHAVFISRVLDFHRKEHRFGYWGVVLLLCLLLMYLCVIGGHFVLELF